MHPMLNIAVRAARQAGNVILRSVDRIDTLTITSKSRNDFVSEVDRNAEQEIIAVIRKHYTNHGILAEESGAQEGEEYVWIIDPLDGTTNFLHGFPQFSVSIGIQHKGVLTHAVVYDPMRQELLASPVPEIFWQAHPAASGRTFSRSQRSETRTWVFLVKTSGDCFLMWW